TPPEIASADLAPLALELASWGAADPADLRWLDAPPAAGPASARALRERPGARGERGRITKHGRRRAPLPGHSPLGHMLLASRKLGAVRTAARLAALMSDRDLLRGGREPDADIRARLALLSGDRAGDGAAAGASRRGALRRAQRTADELARRVDAPG